MLSSPIQTKSLEDFSILWEEGFSIHAGDLLALAKLRNPAADLAVVKSADAGIVWKYDNGEIDENKNTAMSEKFVVLMRRAKGQTSIDRLSHSNDILTTMLHATWPADFEVNPTEIMECVGRNREAISKIEEERRHDCLRENRARVLWSMLGCIPVDENDRIQKSFLTFAPGTHQRKIWAWLVREYKVSLNWLLYGFDSEHQLRFLNYLESLKYRTNRILREFRDYLRKNAAHDGSDKSQLSFAQRLLEIEAGFEMPEPIPYAVAEALRQAKNVCGADRVVFWDRKKYVLMEGANGNIVSNPVLDEVMEKACASAMEINKGKPCCYVL